MPCVVLVACGVPGAMAATADEAGTAANDNRIPGHYIVVLKDSVEHPGAVAQAQTEQRDGDLGFVYRHALEGYSAELPKDEVGALRRDPRVAYVTADRRVRIQEEEVGIETENNEGVEIFEPTTPTGINRVFAPGNKALDIDGKDDLRANVDVAVIDTGIDFEHPDLNVVSRTNCTSGACVDNTGVDGNSHGTHVAGTIGALDNGEGVVGIAPGARMWAVKVLNDGGSGNESWIVAGVDWVTAHAKEIEVANMSLGCGCTLTALDTAINKSVEAGVVYAVAAGNGASNASFFSPASNPNVIAVSALADYDGLPGGKSGSTCKKYGLDDRLASFSNYGSAVDIVAPGVCILSTEPGKKYGYKSGTSMASPHVAGAAAILAAESNPNSKKDVEAIRSALLKAGNAGWTDTSGDGIQEPLLDVSSEATFSLLGGAPEATTEAAKSVSSTKATLNATVNPNGNETKYHFEYGTTTSYGTKTPEISAGSGTFGSPVSETISGLLSSTTYHFRVVATNSGGTATGADQTFTTSAPLWALQTTTNPPATARELRGISCPSSTYCAAAGLAGGPLVERWNGVEWETQTVPVPKGSSFSELSSVSCSSSTACMAVGSFGGPRVPLAERWNGTEWSVVTVPSPKAEFSQLNGVACTSSTSCIAVGVYGYPQTMFAEKWNGTEWSMMTTPGPVGVVLSRLSGISCSSSTACTATGWYTTGSISEAPLAMRWNGAEWSPQSAPVPGGALRGSFTSVSCSSSTACTAAGSYENSSFVRLPVAERWNGTEWKIQTTPAPSGAKETYLNGVSCPSATFCDAIGYYRNSSSVLVTLSEQWNGAEWKVQTTPNPAGAMSSRLDGISCTSSLQCLAVGNYFSGTGSRLTLGEIYQ